MATNTTTQGQFFVITNMRNVNWNSDIPKASFSLTILVGDGSLGGPQMRDNILKCHNGNYWIEGKQEKATTPWTDRSGKVHNYSAINSFHTSHMDKALLQQLTDYVVSLYNTEGDYEALNNAGKTTAAQPAVTAAQPAATATTPQNGTTVQAAPAAQPAEAAVAK